MCIVWIVRLGLDEGWVEGQGEDASAVDEEAAWRYKDGEMMHAHAGIAFRRMKVSDRSRLAPLLSCPVLTIFLPEGTSMRKYIGTSRSVPAQGSRTRSTYFAVGMYG